jgi:hypothetical protein
MDIPPEVLAAKELAEPALMLLPDVIGVGLGLREDENGELFEDELAVRIYLDADGISSPDLPAEVGGIPICVVRDHIEPLAAPDVTRYPELAGGIRIERPTPGAGTMGALVEDASNPGTLLGLTNFHVVGNVGGTFPDIVWQPATPPLAIGIRPSADNDIGAVVRAAFPQLQPIPFVTVQVGLVDAAVFAVDVGLGQNPPSPGDALLAPADRRTTSAKIVGQGGAGTTLVTKVTATAAPTFLGVVTKRGFATRVTTGRVIDAHARFDWPTDHSGKHIIGQMLIAGSSDNANGLFCDQGDSGSLVLDANTSTAVGLLWGRMGAGTRGIASPIRDVESELGVTVAWAP